MNVVRVLCFAGGGYPSGAREWVVDGRNGCNFLRGV